MDKKIEKILVEYREKLSLYGEYCIVVCSLLESLLKMDGYKYQLSYRIKNVDSVREKIQRKNTESKVYKHLSDIEDILGIRIVFYTEADRKKFISKLSGELKEQVHFEEKIRVSGYRSTHALIEFGGERIYLAEYAKFKGLKCEVQLTLILNHAWAEVEHDILYKESEMIPKLNKKRYLILKDRLERVMVDYIKKASKELESIVTEIRGIDIKHPTEEIKK
jgi:ppGpp synthetase/RelA/SpoT-type nucleotidyltranferase